jgi:hypothetical protein
MDTHNTEDCEKPEMKSVVEHQNIDVVETDLQL